MTGPIEFPPERFLRTKVFLLRHFTKLLPAGAGVIAIGFTIASYVEHLRAANRITLVLALVVWLTLLLGATLWAARSPEAGRIAEGRTSE